MINIRETGVILPSLLPARSNDRSIDPVGDDSEQLVLARRGRNGASGQEPPETAVGRTTARSASRALAVEKFPEHLCLLEPFGRELRYETAIKGLLHPQPDRFREPLK